MAAATPGSGFGTSSGQTLNRQFSVAQGATSTTGTNNNSSGGGCGGDGGGGGGD
jgi:hypothetical protein